jgi:hypothetical protein
MASFDEEIGGRYDPPVRSADDCRVVPDPDDLAAAGGQQVPDRGDKAKLTQVSDGDGDPPPFVGPAARARSPFWPGTIIGPTAGYLR